MSAFTSGEKTWIRHLGGLRNVIRQELIRRQLASHVAPGSTVLDVGCGQGTQALWLAERGCRVTGVEPSPTLRDRCLDDAGDRGLAIELIDGTLEELSAAVGGRYFDVVCAHGLLMYLDDRDGAIGLLGDRVAPGGILSLAFRNGDALVMRPALRRDWAAALDAFSGLRYVNGLGVEARADRLPEVTAVLERAGFGGAARRRGDRRLPGSVPSDCAADPSHRSPGRSGL